MILLSETRFSVQWVGQLFTR